jgi:2-methylcitrate dehydratase PrpD
LLRRRAGLREYSMEWLSDPTMQSTMRKVKTIHDEEIAAMGVEKMRSVVEVELTDGRVIRREASDARGTHPEGGQRRQGHPREAAEAPRARGEVHGVRRIRSRRGEIQGNPRIDQAT